MIVNVFYILFVLSIPGMLFEIQFESFQNEKLC